MGNARGKYYYYKESEEFTRVDPNTFTPKATAQTGDNRPIEIMMASVAVFSLLAAAAFLLDKKRKYSR